MNKLRKVYRYFKISDHFFFRLIDFVATIGTIVAIIICIATIKTPSDNLYIRSIFSSDLSFLLIVIIVSIILLRMFVLSFLELIIPKTKTDLKHLPYIIDINNSNYSLEQLINEETERIFLTAQNWASSFEKLKNKLKEFLGNNNSKELTIVLTDPEIMRKIFDSSKKGRNSDDCFAHYIKKGGTLYQLKDWINALSEKDKKKLNIYIHPGSTSLSSHLVEYRNRSNILVITPKYATAPASPRLSLIIDSEDNEDAYTAILTIKNSMTQKSNTRIEELFEKYIDESKGKES